MVDTKVYSTILLFPLAGAVTADKATPYTNALAFRRTPGCASNPTTVLVWAGLQASARPPSPMNRLRKEAACHLPKNPLRRACKYGWKCNYPGPKKAIQAEKPEN